MSCVKTYSPEFTEVIISNDAIDYTVTGFAEGTFISVEPRGDRIVPTYGAKGEAYRAVNPVNAFDMTLTLSQTSHANDVLTLLLRNDRETLDGTFTLSLIDSSGTTVFTENCAYIGMEPTQVFAGGGSIETREWTIHMPNPKDYTIGGNGRFSEEGSAAVSALGGTVESQWTPRT